MNDKGLVFASDVSTAFLLLLGLFYVILFSTYSILFLEAEEIRQAKKEKNALLWLDSIVKNPSRALAGGAWLDHDKKRVESNVIEYEEIKAFGEREFGVLREAGTKPKEFYITYLSGARETLYENRERLKDCIVLERFVLVKKGSGLEKVKIGLVACDA